jgi:hypothetical protein
MKLREKYLQEWLLFFSLETPTDPFPFQNSEVKIQRVILLRLHLGKYWPPCKWLCEEGNTL